MFETKMRERRERWERRKKKGSLKQKGRERLTKEVNAQWSLTQGFDCHIFERYIWVVIFGVSEKKVFVKLFSHSLRGIFKRLRSVVCLSSFLVCLVLPFASVRTVVVVQMTVVQKCIYPMFDCRSNFETILAVLSDERDDKKRLETKKPFSFFFF